MTVEEAKADLKGQSISAILEGWDRGLNADYDAFVRTALATKVRDRDIVDGGNAALAIEAQLDAAIKYATNTQRRLKEAEARQQSFTVDLAKLTDGVDALYAKEEPAFAAGDKERAAAYAEVISLYDESQSVLMRLERHVQTHNAANAAPPDDFGRIVSVIDLQLTALQALAHQTADLEAILSFGR